MQSLDIVQDILQRCGRLIPRDVFLEGFDGANIVCGGESLKCGNPLILTAQTAEHPSLYD